MRVLVPPHAHQHLVWSVFFIVGIWIGVYLFFAVILMCIYLMTRDVEHIFMRLLVIWISLVKCLLKDSADFKIDLFFLPCFENSNVANLVVGSRG